MTAPHEISVPKLLRRLGTADCPTLVDLCLPDDFAQDPFLIPGAIKHDFADLPGLAKRLGQRPSVVYCQRGRKISQGASAWLRAQGLKSDYLEGGMVAWRETPGCPRTSAQTLAKIQAPASLWVTRHRPKIDRLACPWLIRRFIDPEAQFLYVAPDSVLDVAERFGATAFDIEGAPFDHAGAHCTFDALIAHFDLRTDPLERMAQVIRAADTGKPHDHPVAAGLLAISVGLSRQYPDDTALLTAGIDLYDALFRWARDGHTETHACPSQKKS